MLSIGCGTIRSSASARDSAIPVAGVALLAGPVTLDRLMHGVPPIDLHRQMAHRPAGVA